jgi:hypothetical protein
MFDSCDTYPKRGYCDRFRSITHSGFNMANRHVPFKLMSIRVTLHVDSESIGATFPASQI